MLSGLTPIYQKIILNDTQTFCGSSERNAGSDVCMARGVLTGPRSLHRPCSGNVPRPGPGHSRCMLAIYYGGLSDRASIVSMYGRVPDCFTYFIPIISQNTLARDGAFMSL